VLLYIKDYDCHESKKENKKMIRARGGLNMKSDIEKLAECGLQNGAAMMNRESQRLDAALYGAVVNAFGRDAGAGGKADGAGERLLS